MDAIPPEQKAAFDGEFLTAIAEQPNEILKCAMYLFMGYFDGATLFAHRAVAEAATPRFLGGRKNDEDDRRFAYRCMMQAHRMMNPSQPKHGMGGRR